MDPASTIVIANGAMLILETVLPLIKDALSKGEITIEQQAALKARIDALRDKSAFVGPEWEA